jgi:hypothetical protein
MKHLTLLMIIILLLAIGCQEKTSNQNIFSSQTDTLFITTTKLKGDSLFNLRASSATFRDTSDWKKLDWFQYYPDYPIIYPDSIKNLELGFIILMFDSLSYYDFDTKKVYKQKNYSLADREILMIKGLMQDKEIFIVDQNNNKDLTDDTIRVFQEWNWKSDANLIPLQYNIDFGNVQIHETGWYKIGLNRGELLNSNSQFLMSRFTIDDEVFVIGVADNNGSTFDFHRPIMYPFVENGIARDTLITGDVIKLNEYIKLGSNYYRFDKLYNGSGTIVLIKERNFNNLVGTQIGMIAPTMNFETITGEKYNLKDLSEKPILIANITGCTPRTYNLYKNIIYNYSDKITVIGVEYDIEENIGGLIVDISDSLNNDFYNAYRNAYSSFDCYLINKEKRIIDKFAVFDWKKTIANHFDDKN